MLNYLTLKISDADAVEDFTTQRSNKFDQIYWPAKPFYVIAIVLNVINFVNKTRQSEVSLLYACSITFGIVIITCLRYSRLKKHSSKFIVTLFPLYVGILVNLAIRNMLPFGVTVDMEDIEFF